MFIPRYDLVPGHWFSPYLKDITIYSFYCHCVTQYPGVTLTRELINFKIKDDYVNT